MKKLPPAQRQIVFEFFGSGHPEFFLRWPIQRQCFPNYRALEESGKLQKFCCDSFYQYPARCLRQRTRSAEDIPGDRF
jgi:hypothetical protein